MRFDGIGALAPGNGLAFPAANSCQEYEFGAIGMRNHLCLRRAILLLREQRRKVYGNRAESHLSPANYTTIVTICQPIASQFESIAGPGKSVRATFASAPAP